MSATQLKLRRGTNSVIMANTPAEGEIWYNTTTGRIHIGDGITQGGIIHALGDDLATQKFSFATVGGTGNAITLTTLGVVDALAAGIGIEFICGATNSGAVTAALDGLTPKAIMKQTSSGLSVLAAGDLVLGQIYRIVYDNTQYQLITSPYVEPDAPGLKLIAKASGGGSSYDFTTGINSTFDNYLFVLAGVSSVANGGFLQMQTRRAGQGSFDTGGSDYIIPGGTSSAMTLHNGVDGVTSASYGAAGTVLLTRATTTGAGKFVNFNLTWQNASSQPKNFTGWGYRNTPNNGTDPMDGVRFSMSVGNIAGEIAMYGYKKTP